MTLLLPSDKAAVRPNSIAAPDVHTSYLPQRAPNAARKRGPAILAGSAAGPVRGEAQLSALIGAIYDAALEPARWPGALRQTVDFVGGVSATVYHKDAAARQGNVYHDCGGRDPHYQRLYYQDYIKIDPTMVGLWYRETGKVLSVGDLLDLDEFYGSRFYREWVRPQKHVDAVSVALDKTATGVALFTVFRHEQDGLVDAEARRRMALVAPHVRRAALVGRTIEHKTAEAATLADTLDGLSAAMFLVDADARVVHANASAQAMLRAGLVLRAASGKLAAADAQASRALGDAVAAAKGGDAAVGRRGVAVPLAARDGERYVAHALPLASAARSCAGASRTAVAALFVQKAALEIRAAPEVMAKTYNLTPTELRVLLSIVETGGVPETAEALGIGQATVKTHLHRLFAKTDTRRQSELVKLVAGLSSPLAG